MNILFENEHLVALDKPSGLLVHQDGKTDEVSVVDWVKSERPTIVGVGEPFSSALGELIDRPGIVHRLDKDTSGVLLVAKTQSMYLFLKRQFQRHQIKKKYHAFVYGGFPDDRGTIDRPVGRSASDFRKYTSSRSVRGELRKAVTRWHSLLKGSQVTFLEAQPITGRTHQIRVHFHAIGHPIVCDPLYASGAAPLLGFSRLALHARAITFRLPDGEEKTVISPYPVDFAEAIELFRSQGAISPTGLRQLV